MVERGFTRDVVDPARQDLSQRRVSGVVRRHGMLDYSIDGTAMPIYEYVCDDCSHAFEAIVRGQHLPHCPRCDGEALSRQLSVFAVSTTTSSSAGNGDEIQPCGACGDPRGAGACSIN